MTLSTPVRHRDRLWVYGLLILLAAVTVWSWIGATDRGTWWLESFPIWLALPVLFLSYRRFTFTRLTYALITLHACILLVGAHYTYAHVPLFDWVRDTFHLQRNDYDKVGHLAQGFVPAIVAREVLTRLRVVRGVGWRFFIVMSICMGISACYELVEWAVALAEGSGADAFLGTQGDVWDTQSDMFCALIGAAAAQLLLGWWHDREMRRLGDGLAVDSLRE